MLPRSIGKATEIATEADVEQAALGWWLRASNGGWYTLRTLQQEALHPRLVSEVVMVEKGLK